MPLTLNQRHCGHAGLCGLETLGSAKFRAHERRSPQKRLEDRRSRSKPRRNTGARSTSIAYGRSAFRPRIPQQASYGPNSGNTPDCERLRLHNHAFSDEFWKHIANRSSERKGDVLKDEGLSISTAFEKRSPIHRGRACHRRGRPQCCEIRDTRRNDGLGRQSCYNRRSPIRAVRCSNPWPPQKQFLPMALVGLTSGPALKSRNLLAGSAPTLQHYMGCFGKTTRCL
jgi:hypothetical protein